MTPLPRRRGFRQAPADAAKIVLRSLLERGVARGEVRGEDRSRERVGGVNVAVGGGNGFIWAADGKSVNGSVESSVSLPHIVIIGGGFGGLAAARGSAMRR